MRFWWLLALVALAGPPPAARAGTSEAHLVVERVESDGAAARAGLERGDLLLEWERPSSNAGDAPAARGALLSVFDLQEAELEQAPRGALRLSVERAGKPLEVELSAGPWGLEARPPLSEPGLATYRLGLELFAAGRCADAVELWRGASGADGDGVSAGEAVWWQLAAAQRSARAGCAAQADSAFEAALESAARLPGGARAEAWVREAWGDALRARGDLDGAECQYLLTLELRRDEAPRSVALAGTLVRLGRVAGARRDLELAIERARLAVEMLEELAAESLPHADALSLLGRALRGDLPRAEAYHRRALAIRERWIPGSADVAASWSDLGVALGRQGDFTGAEQCLLRALAIHQKLAPGGAEVGDDLGNLGIVALRRGDLAAAESYQLRALAISERLEPRSWGLAATLDNLGSLARLRGDLGAAESYLRRSLDMRRSLGPESLETAIAFSNLGSVRAERGDFAGAEENLRSALELKERLAPDSLEVAEALVALAQLAVRRGDLETARRQQERAVSLHERLAPGSVYLATAASGLGEIARRSGDHGAAENALQRALSLLSDLAPGSVWEAESLHALALLRRDQDRPREAKTLLERALDALDAQEQKLGGPGQARAEFRARMFPVCFDAVAVLIDLGELERAFDRHERCRAQGLRALLAERELVLDDVPPELDRERRTLDAEYGRIYARLGVLSAADSSEASALRRELERLRLRRRELEAALRAASPALSRLAVPSALALSEVRAALAPGTLLLSFLVGEDRTFLFSLGGAGALRWTAIDAGDAELAREVAELRELIEARQAGLVRPRYLGRAARLSRLLLGSAADEIAAASRLLIVPDGPLHALPFAALPAPGDDANARYLIEGASLHVAASATVYAELAKRGRREPGPVVAFGDPRYPAVPERSGEPALRSARRSGLALEPLAHSRRELDALREVFGERAVVWIGEQATEERARAVGPEASMLHFACHGFVDERFPLDSALALSIPDDPREGAENGLLQAWEILESVRLDADLVTLSACDTGLGRRLPGEGVLGFTQVFHQAGARAVLTSLWQVADRPTAELMARFYRNLRDGHDKAEALRRAQLHFLRHPLAVDDDTTFDASQPFYWAAFTLSGDPSPIAMEPPAAPVDLRE